ncbi:hypothetical protein BGZ80_010085 [Entomortierella chlamydospora]|uniref:Uncharacterized protein n=1 Tax=Entomortierella chlamydospora TaxID=101097 RepID=A0A9P6MW55_9FUNG|nr:hypothetical protein BGZ80_010085 [Entomortierella chlamydospora]
MISLNPAPSTATLIATSPATAATTTTLHPGANTPFVTPTSPSPILTSPFRNSTLGFGGPDDFQISGDYIYVILLIALIIAVVYFARVLLAKRQEKLRSLKEQDCEVPPEYSSHTLDIQVFDGNSPNTSFFPSFNRVNRGPRIEPLSETLSSSQPTINAVSLVQPPARALIRTPPPPTYDGALGLPEINIDPYPISVESDTTAADAASQPSQSPRPSSE